MTQVWRDDYDNEQAFREILADLTPLGFVDTSHLNDVCPSMAFLNSQGEKIVTVWVDYHDPGDREDPELGEFTVDFGGFGVDVERSHIKQQCEQALEIWSMPK